MIACMSRAAIMARQVLNGEKVLPFYLQDSVGSNKIDKPPL